MQRPIYLADRLPSLPLPQPNQAYSSGTSSPRLGSLGSSILNGGTHTPASSYTTGTLSNGPKTPSPTLPSSNGLPAPIQQHSPYSGPPSSAGYSYGQEPYTNMNQGPPQDMYYSSHISAGQQPAPQTVTAGIPHYPHHQQPPLLQPGPNSYQSSQPYPQYAYANGLTSPQSAGHPIQGSMGQQGNVLPLPALSAGASPYQGGVNGFDTTGQIAPHGMKPRVTATLWEDEGSLCFQVEAKGVCVARREGWFTCTTAVGKIEFQVY